MILGIVLHSAQVFNPAQSWVIHSQHSTPIAGALVSMIHLFRMPAFFIISGFFCVFTLQKYGPSRMIQLRLVRIAIPLLTTAIVLNSLQTYILASSGWASFVPATYFLQGEWVSHLWFLVNLIVYFIGAFVLAHFLRDPIRKLGAIVAGALLAIPIAASLLILPLFSIGILAAGKLGFPLYTELLGIFETYSIMMYLPYFAFGAVLGVNRELLLRFSTINPLISIFVLLVAGAANIWIPWPEGSGIEKIVDVYLHTLQIWFSASLCFYVFHSFCNVKSTLFSFLSEASYSIYLLHHVFVIGLGLILIKMNIGGSLGLTLLIAIVTAITASIHYFLIARSNVLRFAFNGK